MENLEIILSLTGTALGVLITAATFIVKFIKSAKAKKIAEDAIEICNAVLPYIKQAESFIHFSGAEKKEYVMLKVNEYADKNGFKLSQEFAAEKIDELVALTKEVNIRGKDMQSIEANLKSNENPTTKIITIPKR